MQYDSMDECQYCVRTFWKPWLRELLDIEGIAKEEETAATLDARDSISKSERDLALRRRQVAAEAVLSIRSAKRAVMDALDAIDAEKAKRYADDKEKYGITIKKSETDTKYKEHISKAIKAKKLQEIQFEIMNEWSKKWKERQESIDKSIAEDSGHSLKERVIKKTNTNQEEEDEPKEPPLEDSDISLLKKKLGPVHSKHKGGLSRKAKRTPSKEEHHASKKSSPTGSHGKEYKKESPDHSKDRLGPVTDKDKHTTGKKEKTTEMKKMHTSSKEEVHMDAKPQPAEKKETSNLPAKDTTENKGTENKGSSTEKKELSAKPGDEKVNAAAATTAKKETAVSPTSSTSEKKEPASPPSHDKTTPEKDKDKK